MKNRLLDLMIEFDEMGFAPTTVCENAEEYATKWEDQVREAVKALENENAALRERLEKTEHRAKGAERALKRFAENISCEDCPFFSDCSSLEKMKYSVHPNYCFAEYLRQAEKELAEEGKS